jgi:hypothetical protein
VDDPEQRKERQRRVEIEQIVSEEQKKGTKGKVYKGEEERAEDVIEECLRLGNIPLLLRVLRAEGWSATQIAALEKSLREQRERGRHA